MKRLVIILPLALLLGCGDGVSSDSSDATAKAVLSFNADWSVEQSSPLVEGRRARVVYDETRLPDCRGEMNGNPAWSINGYAQLEDGEVTAFHVAGFDPNGGGSEPIIELDGAGDLAVWFEVHNRWGCIAYDSDYGDNFHFWVDPAE